MKVILGILSAILKGVMMAISLFTCNRQLSPTLPDSPTHDKITPTIPAKWNGLRWST